MTDMNRLDVPLLVIGLGGTGLTVLQQVKQLFADRFRKEPGGAASLPARTAYLGIDTDPNSMRLMDRTEFLDVSAPGLERLLDPFMRSFNLTEGELAWLHPSVQPMGFGTSGVRQLGRFMLNRHYDRVVEAITGALRRVTADLASDGQRRIEVAVLTGVCGGTGGGMFLDVPQIVRHCMHGDEALGGMDVHITGYVVMPDVSMEVACDPISRMRLQANGYAALKELDYWMQVRRHKAPYAMQFSTGDVISWDEPPYHACVMISGVQRQGVPARQLREAAAKLAAAHLLRAMTINVPQQNGAFTFSLLKDNAAAGAAVQPVNDQADVCCRTMYPASGTNTGRGATLNEYAPLALMRQSYDQARSVPGMPLHLVDAGDGRSNWALLPDIGPDPGGA